MDIQQFDIREDFIINHPFRIGSSTHAQNRKFPKHVIDAQNRWSKVEREKGRRAKFSMVESYADVEQLIPNLVRYYAML